MALPMILLTTSPMPIGLTPGRLSNGIKRQATYACSEAGSMYLEAILLAQLARASHRVSEVALNEVHILRHSSAAIPDGPAAPWVFSAAALMVFLVILANSAEYGTYCTSPCMMLSQSSGAVCGCFSFSISLTLFPFSSSSMLCRPPG